MAPRKAPVAGRVKVLEEPVQLPTYESPFEAAKIAKQEEAAQRAAAAERRATASSAEVKKQRATFLKLTAAQL